MKQLLILVIATLVISFLLLGLCSILIPKYEPVTNPSEMKPLPDYSLEEVMPQSRYYEWDKRYRKWFVLYDRSKAKGPVMKVEKFFVDRRKGRT